MNRHVVMIACVATIGLPASAGEPARFQGLDGTSGESDFVRAFAHAERKTWCNNGQSEGRGPDGPMHCNYYVVPNYPVADVDLSLLATFTTSGTLKEIALYRFYGFPADDNIHPSDVEIYSNHSKLKALLSSRYPGAAPRNLWSMTSATSIWFHDRWELGAMSVALKSHFSKRSPTAKWEGEISINYLFRNDLEAEKL